MYQILLSLIFLLRLAHSFAGDHSCTEGIWALVQQSPDAIALNDFYYSMPKDPNGASGNLKAMAEEFAQTWAALSGNVLRLHESNTLGPYRMDLALEEQIQVQIRKLGSMTLKALMQIHKVELELQGNQKPHKLWKVIGCVGAIPVFPFIGLGGETDHPGPALIGFSIAGVTAILTYTTYRLQRFFSQRNAPRIAQKLWNIFVTQSGLYQLVARKDQQPLVEEAQAAFCQLALLLPQPHEVRRYLPATTSSD